MTPPPHYPHVTVPRGSASREPFFLLVSVATTLLRNGVSYEQVSLFEEEATSGNTGHLISTCAAWVTLT